MKDVFSASKLKQLFLRYGIKPKKTLGQNFLIDKNIILKIIENCNIKKSDIVVEVGSGCGALTYFIALKARRIFAYEIDKSIKPILKDVLFELGNVVIIWDDVLKSFKGEYFYIKKENNKIRDYILVGNLPYYCAPFIIRRFLQVKNKPKFLIVTLQREVAERICSDVPHMSLIGVMVRFYGAPKILFNISKNCFFPKPRVDSSVLKVKIQDFREKFNLESGFNDEIFFRLVKTGFSSKRKMLINNLKRNFNIIADDLEGIFKKAGVDVKSRAQELSVEDWVRIYLEIENCPKYNF